MCQYKIKAIYHKKMETKVIYYMDAEDKMPYMIKLNTPPEQTKLRDFKALLNLNTSKYKYFFQTIVDDFGTVKEELVDDDSFLPCINGRVVCWLVQTDGSCADSTADRSNHSIEHKFNVLKQNNSNEYTGKHQNIMMSMQKAVSNSSNSIENIENQRNCVNRKSSKLGSSVLPVYESVRKSTLIPNPTTTTATTASSSNVKGGSFRTNGNVVQLKDLKFDDTSTETESMINAFDDLRMNRGGGSMNQHKKPIKQQFSSFNNNQKTTNANRHQHMQHQHQYQQYKGTTTTTTTAHHMLHGKKAGSANRHQQPADSFSNTHDSDDFDDETTEILNDDDTTALTEGTQMTADTQSLVSASELDDATTTFFDTEQDEDSDEDEDDDGQFSAITAETTSSTMSQHPNLKKHLSNKNRIKKRFKPKSSHNHHHHNQIGRASCRERV